MKSPNRVSKFSVQYSKNGDGDSKLDNPSKLKRGGHKKVRLGKRQQKEAEKYGGGSASAIQANLVETLVGKPIKIDGKNWYLYDNGIWKLAGEESLFYNHAWEVQAPDNRNARTRQQIIGALISKWSLQLGEKFYGCIRPDTCAEDCYLLNCPSNVLQINVNTGKIVQKIAHEASHMFTSSLTADYIDDACCPMFEKVSKQILPDENDRELLMLFFAYCLFPSCQLETALFCIGSGGNGKSVLTNAIANVFGRDNRLSITLKEICKKDRKQLVRLERKLVNLSTEVEVDPIKDSATFKMLVSGEDIETDRLYREGITINPGCKYCLLMNHMPEFGKGSDAEVRRTKIIHFPAKFVGDKRDPTIGTKLVAEKEGILRMLIDRLDLIATMNSMPTGGTESKLAEEAFGVSNNPITAFVDKCLEITDNRFNFVGRKQVHELYSKFASTNSLEHKNEVHLMRELYEAYPKIQTEERKTINGEQKRIVRFVRIKNKTGKDI